MLNTRITHSLKSDVCITSTDIEKTVPLLYNKNAIYETGHTHEQEKKCNGGGQQKLSIQNDSS